MPRMNLNPHFLLLFLLGIVLSANPCMAAVSPLLSPVEIVGGTTINFDQRPHNSVLNTFYQGQGITFSRDDGQAVLAYDYSAIGRTTPSPPNVLSTSLAPGINTSVGTHLNVLSTSPLYAIGAYWGNDRGESDFTSLSISAFGASGNLLGSVSVLGNGIRSADQFIGLRSDVPFTSIRFQNLNSAGTPSLVFAVAIDDLRFTAVPEPSTLCLFGLSISAALISCFKRRSANRGPKSRI